MLENLVAPQTHVQYQSNQSPITNHQPPNTVADIHLNVQAFYKEASEDFEHEIERRGG